MIHINNCMKTKNEITFHKGNQNGGITIKMRGGRPEKIMKDKMKYSRKSMKIKSYKYFHNNSTES